MTTVGDAQIRATSSQSQLIVPFGANEPEKREGNSDCLCVLVDSSKFVPRNGKIIFMKWRGQYFVVWLLFFPCPDLI